MCGVANVMKRFEIVNGGGFDIDVTAIWPLSDDAGHFQVDLGAGVPPYTLGVGQRRTYNVTFRSLGLTSFDILQEVLVSSTASTGDSIAVLRATCVASSVQDDEQLQLQITIHPQPYRRSSGLPLTVTAPGSILSLTLYDLAGRKLATSPEPSMDPAAFTGPGLYIIHVITDSGPVTLPVFCID
jgi:hypothetical protein